MALSTKLGRDIPEGAIALSREEALDHQKGVIQDWPVETDVIFLKHGSKMTLATTLVSSGIIFEYFRRAMSVRKKYVALLITPSLILPALLSGKATEKFITDENLLMKIKCPMCSQIKFTLAQLYCSLIFPGFYAFGSFASLGYIKHSYSFGGSSKDAVLFWKEVFTLMKGGTRYYQAVGLLQTVLILGLPYMQSKELAHVMNKIRQTDELLGS